MNVGLLITKITLKQHRHLLEFHLFFKDMNDFFADWIIVLDIKRILSVCVSHNVQQHQSQGIFKLQ